MHNYMLKARLNSFAFALSLWLAGTLLVFQNNNNPFQNFRSTQFISLIGNEEAATSQTINFPSISDRILGNNTVNLNATASSGLPVSYEVVSGPATVSGSKLTITGVGVISVMASQSGDGQYNAATPVQREFVVDFKNQKEVDPEEACLDNTKLKIVVIGSSSAAGYRVEPIELAWAYRLETYLKEMNPENELINYGVNGYTSYSLMPSDYTSPSNRDSPDPEKNITKALAQNPDGIIVNCPSNDVRKNYQVEEMLDNFKVIFNLAMEKNIPIWITTTQPRSFLNDSDEVEATKVLRQIEGKDRIEDIFGTYALDFWTGIATPEGKIKDQYSVYDSLHINPDGHAIFFQRVLDKNVIGRTIGVQFPDTDFNIDVNLGPDITATAGETVTLDAGPGYSSYLWSDGSKNRTLTVSASGNYSVTVTSDAGCSGSDAVKVTFEQASAIQLNVTPQSPTMDNLKLQLNTDDTSTDVTIKLIQTSGKQQANLKVSAGDIINGFLLKNLVSLQPGTYQVSLRQADQTVQQLVSINP